MSHLGRHLLTFNRFAPLDHPCELPLLRKLADHFHIPSRFVSERLNSVTYSFGTNRSLDGSSECGWMIVYFTLQSGTDSGVGVWAHFLGAVPFEHNSQAQEGWRGHKQAIYVQWTPAIPSASFPLSVRNGTPVPRKRVKMICFGPDVTMMTRLEQMWASPGSSWAQEVLGNPYLLLGVVYECWYETLDKSAWKVVDMASTVERVRDFNIYIRAQYLTSPAGYFPAIQATLSFRRQARCRSSCGRLHGS
jgi:hypothetical protein